MFNIKLHDHCVYWSVYWPVNKTMSIKCSMYFAVAKWLEAKHLDVPSSKALTSEPSTAPMPAPPALMFD